MCDLWKSIIIHNTLLYSIGNDLVSFVLTEMVCGKVRAINNGKSNIQRQTHTNTADHHSHWPPRTTTILCWIAWIELLNCERLGNESNSGNTINPKTSACAPHISRMRCYVRKSRDYIVHQPCSSWFAHVRTHRYWHEISMPGNVIENKKQ